MKDGERRRKEEVGLTGESPEGENSRPAPRAHAGNLFRSAAGLFFLSFFFVVYPQSC